MLEAPSIHAIGAMLATLVTFGLFAFGRIRLELICLGLIAVLALGFYFFPFVQAGRFTSMEVAFGGFSHEALVAICCLMILGRGLLVTGALEPATRLLGRLWRFNSSLGLLATILICFTMSMFVNDTPVLILTLPVLLSVAARANIPASKSLMPVNCAILIGGMATTIGTSTNLLVVSIAADLGEAPIGLFDFAPIVLAAACVALPYLWLVMPRLLPSNDTATRSIARRYRAALHWLPESRRLEGGMSQLKRLVSPNLLVEAVIRRRERIAPDAPSLAIEPGDRVLVQGTPEELREAGDTLRVPLASPDVIETVRESASRERQGERIAELVVGFESSLLGQSIKTARIADRYGVAVLGSARAEALPFREHASEVEDALDVGDVLLVQGTPDRLISMELGEGALLLEGGLDVPHTARANVATVIVAGVVMLAAFNVVPIAIAALAGTIAMLATGCIRFENIGRALKFEVIVLVAASIALGRALVETNAAQWLGEAFGALFHGLPPAWILAALMAFTTVLTNFVSNAAAAAVATPIAVSLASALEHASEPFVLAVLFGCNLCYVTPMAYQTNLLIMSAARYRFVDFLRAGLPLALLMIVTLAGLLVVAYEL